MEQLDTGTHDLLASVDDGVAVLTLHRPDHRNALSEEMLDALERQLAALEADGDVGAVVLTGAGGAFCAGGDVKGFVERASGAGPPSGQEQHRRARQRGTTGRLWRMSTPTLAMLRGAAAGGGLSLALACDLRYAAPGAVLTTAFPKVGLSGDYGSAWLLVQLVGPARARELLLLSPRLGAEEAQQLGLVNAVVATDDLEQHVLDVARRLAHGPRTAQAYIKDNVRLALGSSLEDYLDVEITHHLACFATDDHREAARAFVEKRQPVFRRG